MFFSRFYCDLKLYCLVREKGAFTWDYKFQCGHCDGFYHEGNIRQLYIYFTVINCLLPNIFVNKHKKELLKVKESQLSVNENIGYTCLLFLMKLVSSCYVFSLLHFNTFSSFWIVNSWICKQFFFNKIKDHAIIGRELTEMCYHSLKNKNIISQKSYWFNRCFTESS